MVTIDERWEYLKLIRFAGWKAPADHPGLDPPHEALQLAEHYRELGRQPDARRRPEDFRRWLTESEQASHDLEAALRAKRTAAAEAAFRRAGAACTDCHAKYRDVPQRP
jgi:hypothetical protein